MSIFTRNYLYRNYKSPGQEEREAEERKKAEEKKLAKEKENQEFIEKYGDEVKALFEDYPEVTFCCIFGQDYVKIHVKGRDEKVSVYIGRIVLKDGKVALWADESSSLRYEVVPEDKKHLADKVKVAKLKDMLKDNDKIRKYCDIVASQLLENDRQAFNALEGLGYKQERFEAEFYDESWIEAWQKALLTEFSAKSVEYKGNGLFMLTAI